MHSHSTPSGSRTANLVLKKYTAGGKAKAGEDATKPWRLAIKRRLLKQHQEELDALLSVKAMEEKDAAKEAKEGKEAKEAAAPASSSAAAEGSAPSKADLVAARKARLEELFQELLGEYDAVLARVQK